MIRINSSSSGIRITGHAGYAPLGYDIICSAVSTLFTNLINSIDEFTDGQIDYEMKSGDSYIVYRNESEGMSLLVRSFLLGVSVIAEAYPAYVQVTRDESQ